MRMEEIDNVPHYPYRVQWRNVIQEAIIRYGDGGYSVDELN